MGIIPMTKLQEIKPIDSYDKYIEEKKPEKKPMYNLNDIARMLLKSRPFAMGYAEATYYDKDEKGKVLGPFTELLLFGVDKNNMTIPTSEAVKPCPRCGGDTGYDDPGTFPEENFVKLKAVPLKDIPKFY